MSRAGLRILAAGPGVTIQDGGRRGFLRFGVTESGPMDRLAHHTANRAAGVPADSAAIEISLGGLELKAESVSLTVAIAGGAFNISLDGAKLPATAIVRLDPGHKLTVRSGASGAWCYLAVKGRFDLPAVLGSVSVYTRSGLGGAPLEAGTLLPVIDAQPAGPRVAEILAPWLERPGEIIRVIPGPQDDYFSAGQTAHFFAASWMVSHRCDRMAYLLDGPKLAPAKGFNIISDGTAPGSIQIPGAGQPIVLMADRPPTGGYPKIATVIGPDLGRLSQLRPGHKFRFARSSVAEAVLARRQEMEALAQSISMREWSDAFAPQRLLGQNLVDGVTDGEC